MQIFEKLLPILLVLAVLVLSILYFVFRKPQNTLKPESMELDRSVFENYVQ